MSDTGDLAGLSLAVIVFSLSWPAARKYFKQWTWSQKLKFVASILLCAAFGVFPIPLLNLLTPRNAAGQAPPDATAGAALVMFGWIFLGVLLLLRYLMDEPQPKWVKRFGIPYVLAVTMVAVGLGILLAVRYG